MKTKKKNNKSDPARDAGIKAIIALESLTSKAAEATEESAAAWWDSTTEANRKYIMFTYEKLCGNTK